MVEVVKVAIEDIEELQSICMKSYTKVFANHWTGNGLALYLEEQFNTTRLLQEINHSDYTYFFIRKNEENIGFVKVNYNTSEVLSNLENCELEKIYILPAFSGLGIGNMVMQDIIWLAKRRGKKIMYVCVLDTNLSAIGFYKKLGFRYHSKARLEAPFFKEELRGMHRMYVNLTRE